MGTDPYRAVGRRSLPPPARTDGCLRGAGRGVARLPPADVLEDPCHGGIHPRRIFRPCRRSEGARPYGHAFRRPQPCDRLCTSPAGTAGALCRRSPGPPACAEARPGEARVGGHRQDGDDDPEHQCRNPGHSPRCRFPLVDDGRRALCPAGRRRVRYVHDGHLLPPGPARPQPRAPADARGDDHFRGNPRGCAESPCAALRLSPRLSAGHPAAEDGHLCRGIQEVGGQHHRQRRAPQQLEPHRGPFHPGHSLDPGARFGLCRREGARLLCRSCPEPFLHPAVVAA